MVVTAPTGNGGGTLLDGREAPHSTLLQPWAGFVETIGRRAYATGFSSVIVPTDSRDPLLLSNSLALGYWLTRHETNGRYTGIVPTSELHINTPLNHRGPGNLVYINDQVNMTNGVNFVLPRATVSVALCTPLAGPLPWRSELLVLLNWRF